MSLGLGLVNGVPYFEVFGAKIHCATIERHGRSRGNTDVTELSCIETFSRNSNLDQTATLTRPSNLNVSVHSWSAVGVCTSDIPPMILVISI